MSFLLNNIVGLSLLIAYVNAAVVPEINISNELSRLVFPHHVTFPSSQWRASVLYRKTRHLRVDSLYQADQLECISMTCR